MDSQKKRPQIYWSQNESEINVKVDLLLDEMVGNVNKGNSFDSKISIYVFFSLFSQKPNIKIDEKFLSLDAYGFGSKNEGPQKYYFELNLFEAINVEVSKAISMDPNAFR